MKNTAKNNCWASAVNTGRKYFFLLAACALTAGCTKIDKAPTFGEGKVIEIRQGTTANFEGLRIGLSNISVSDNAAEKKRSLVAALVLLLDGTPPREKRFDVRAGESAKMDKYTVYVQEIRGGSKGSVLLQVNSAAPSPAP